MDSNSADQSERSIVRRVLLLHICLRFPLGECRGKVLQLWVGKWQDCDYSEFPNEGVNHLIPERYKLTDNVPQVVWSRPRESRWNGSISIKCLKMDQLIHTFSETTQHFNAWVHSMPPSELKWSQRGNQCMLCFSYKYSSFLQQDVL